jgi:hypothetical protein
MYLSIISVATANYNAAKVQYYPCSLRVLKMPSSEVGMCLYKGYEYIKFSSLLGWFKWCVASKEKGVRMNIYLAVMGGTFTGFQAHGAISIYKNQTGRILAISGQSATFSHSCVEHV